MTKTVFCEREDCTHEFDGYCLKSELHLVVSFGRSTDYAHEFQCDDYVLKVTNKEVKEQ